jgi:CubicO group peptidase (beta-lactamase class C family)
MRTWGLLLTGVLASQILFGSPERAVRRLDGSSISSAEIDAAVSRLMSAAEVTGVAIAVLNSGEVVHSKAYGFRDVDKKLPLTEDSVMAAASLTKTAFAYLVMQLADEGTLDLDTPIQQYLPKPLPEYAGYRDLGSDTRYRKVTARMLLSHTSGLPNIRWLESDRTLKIHFEPGSRYAYSGEGMQLLQLVVETAAKKPLQELMQARVFQPLGMTRTSMVSEQRFENDYASGYDEWGRSLGHEQPKTADAAGSMQTTLRDFTKFVQAVIQGKGLSARTRESMLSPQIQIHSQHQFPTFSPATTDANLPIRLSYGLGWGLYWSPYGKVFFKEGHAEGFRNYTAVFSERRDGVVILTNSSNGEGIFKDLLEALLRNTFTPIEWEGFTPYDQLPPRKPLPVHKEIALDAKSLDRFAGRYAVSPDLVLIVTRNGDHLRLQENQEAPEELFPEGELRFFSKTSDDVVTFDIDGEGRVTRLVIHTGGRSIPVNRVD